MDKNKLEKQAIGIVSQLFDLAEVPVKKRQEINDKAYDYMTQQLRLHGVGSSHSTCEDCGGGNVAWGTTDELWNKVADEPKKAVCPQCFVKMAERKLNYKSVIVGFNAEVVNR